MKAFAVGSAVILATLVPFVVAWLLAGDKGVLGVSIVYLAFTILGAGATLAYLIGDVIVGRNT